MVFIDCALPMIFLAPFADAYSASLLRCKSSQFNMRSSGVLATESTAADLVALCCCSLFMCDLHFKKRLKSLKNNPRECDLSDWTSSRGKRKSRLGSGGIVWPGTRHFQMPWVVQADWPFSSWHLSNCFTVGIPDAMAKALSPKSLKLNLKGSGKSESSFSSMSLNLGKRLQKGAVANFRSVIYLSLNVLVSVSSSSP